jgi:5-hydroxyisourate hydrolase-like protein (transthyretin family)
LWCWVLCNEGIRNETAHKPQEKKENVMKNLIKIVTISSFLIIACFLISACGGDAENFVQGNGQIDVTVTDSSTGLALPGVQVQVRKNSVTDPTVISSATTDANGKAVFQETVGSDYYFSFAATGYTSQNYVNNPVTPLLTATITVNVAMVPAP